MKTKFSLLLASAAVATTWSLGNLHAADPADAKASQSSSETGDNKRPDHRGKHHPHFKGGERGPEGHMLRELNLSEEQKAKVKAVMESKKPLLDAIREEQMQKMKIVMEEAEKEIRPILTPEQTQVLDDMKKLQASREKLRKADK